MNRPQLIVLLLLPAFLLFQYLGAPSAVVGQSNEPDVTPPTAWMIELVDPPAAVVYAARLGNSSSAADAALTPAAATAATAAAQVQLTLIATAQQALAQQLTALDVPLLFSVQRVYNGMAVLIDDDQRLALAQLPGVAAIHPMIAKTPDNAASIPYLGIPSLWQGTGFDVAPLGLRGEGVKVAVIDTGIDYLHRDFSGPGLGYLQNNPNIIGDVPGFPGPRIVGGYDFVGDAYNASAVQGSAQLIPAPDPDPMDCYGHGTHVAGTLAGDGVTAAGTTFAGPYDTLVDFPNLEIGPGVAPRADIYALKIFGCSGGTLVTDLAREWAVDPNQDGDFADRMDVVNLSLGSPYGLAYDTSAVAADNAALAGVIVVASAGNSGDTQLIAGAPSIADRAISVAAGQHTGASVTSFSARGPRRGDAALKPDITAPGASIYSAASDTGWQGTTSSGTSMAAPYVAGVMALLRQVRPTWSVEELKALAMNSAGPLIRESFFLGSALEIPVRGGAGLIDPRHALSSTVIAYSADGSGQVSISFGAPEVAATYTATRQVAIANKAATDISLLMSYESRANLPGVTVQTPAEILRIPAYTTIQVPVTLVVDASQLKRVRARADAWLSEPWFAEESGYLTLKPATNDAALITQPAQAAEQPALLLPFYVAPRPVAAMSATSTTLDFNQNLEQTIELAGKSLSGSVLPTDVVSLASVLELRLRSPNTRPSGLDPNARDSFDHADLKYVGVTSQAVAETGEGATSNVEDVTISFGVAMWEPWSTPNEVRVNVLIDTNLDGVDDYRLYNFDAAIYGGLWFGPSYVSRLQDLYSYASWNQGPLNGGEPTLYDSGLFFRSALVLPVSASDLGLSAGQSHFAFHIETTSIDLASDSVTVIDRTPRLYYDMQTPALHFNLPGDLAPLVRDEAQTRIGVRLDPAGQVRAPAAGVLLLHHHNGAGDQASIVTVDYRLPVNLFLPVVRR